MAPHAAFNVTVAIIVHGDPPNIRRTLSSVHAQRYTLGEVTILCLDDGTSPKARDVFDELDVWTVDLPEQSSIAVAKNKALELSDNEFVFFLDDHIYLEAGGLQAAMEAFVRQPDLAGVCGYYRSPKISDWNTLRDIKRHSIYGKSTERRLITLDMFTTFSTGIGIVRRSVFRRLEFPEDTFPPDFGGEDLPALLTALNEGHPFAFVPELAGWHEHNLSFTDLLRKMEIEVRGRFSVFYWASGARGVDIPYLHGVLNFPILLYASTLLAIIASGFGWKGVFAFPGLFLAVETLHSLRCLSTSIDYPLRQRILAACYVLASDVLTPLCAVQYAFSSYKRPYAELSLRRMIVLNRIFLRWEFAKLGFPWRANPAGAQSREAGVLQEKRERHGDPRTGPAMAARIRGIEWRSPADVKISVLCHGLNFPLDLFVGVKEDFYANQYVYGRTSTGALRTHRLPQALQLGEGVISAALRRSESPLSLCLDGGRVLLRDGDRRPVELGLPERPAYFGKTLSNGMRTDDFIAVAGEATPGFFLYPDCHYFQSGEPCKFCSLRHARRTVGKKMADRFDSEAVAEATRVFQQTPWREIPIVSVTTGTFPGGDEGAMYTSRVIRAMYDAMDQKLPIHLLTMPPDSLEVMHEYREAGVTSLAFNIEVFDRPTFEDICPGKARFNGYDKLLEALEYAVGVVGPYNAFCGFVWGLESVESVLEGYRWCLDRGIGVSSNVFHADHGSVFARRPHPAEEYVVALCREQSRLYQAFPEARPIFPASMRSTLDWEIHRGDFR